MRGGGREAETEAGTFSDMTWLETAAGFALGSVSGSWGMAFSPTRGLKTSGCA